MQKLNKNGLFVKRVVGNDFSVGNAVVEGGGASEDLAILNLTKEQMDILSYIVNSEGRNIPINEDGTFDTKIGHSYSVRYTDNLRLEEGYSSEKENFVIEKIGDGQLLFFAISEQCKINNPSYVVTEVFRLAALKDFVDWSGEGEPKWVKRLRVQLTALLDGSEFALEWLPLENKLVLHTDRLDDAALEPVNTLLARVLPQNIEVVRYNHDISFPWQEIPEGFTEVRYLENIEKSWIDTRCFVTSEYSINVRFSTDVKQPGMTNTIFGKRKSYLVNMFALTIINYGTQLQARFGTGGINTKNFELHRSYVATLQNGKYILNSEELSFPKTDYFSADVPLALFTDREEGRVLGEVFNGRIYECVIVDENNSQVFNGIPALDETGAPCMFDLVSKTAFYNQGTGDFLYPTESSTYALRRVLPDWGKLTEHGMRRLYHVPANYNGELYDYAIENGYKHIVESEKPEEGYWTPQWTETDDEIVLEWIETESSTDLETQI